jgi:hypothetical protein
MKYMYHKQNKNKITLRPVTTSKPVKGDHCVGDWTKTSRQTIFKNLSICINEATFIEQTKSFQPVLIYASSHSGHEENYIFIIYLKYRMWRNVIYFYLTHKKINKTKLFLFLNVCFDYIKLFLLKVRCTHFMYCEYHGEGGNNEVLWMPIY